MKRNEDRSEYFEEEEEEEEEKKSLKGAWKPEK